MLCTKQRSNKRKVKKSILSQEEKGKIRQYQKKRHQQLVPTSSPAHLFAIRGKRKRDPGTLQTRD